MARSKKRRRARTDRRPSRRVRDEFIGFQVQGRIYEGRIREVPRTLLQAMGGGVAYNDNEDYSEGEPPEMAGRMGVVPPRHPTLATHPRRDDHSAALLPPLTGPGCRAGSGAGHP